MFAIGLGVQIRLITPPIESIRNDNRAHRGVGDTHKIRSTISLNDFKLDGIGGGVEWLNFRPTVCGKPKMAGLHEEERGVGVVLLIVVMMMMVGER